MMMLRNSLSVLAVRTFRQTTRIETAALCSQFACPSAVLSASLSSPCVRSSIQLPSKAIRYFSSGEAQYFAPELPPRNPASSSDVDGSISNPKDLIQVQLDTLYSLSSPENVETSWKQSLDAIHAILQLVSSSPAELEPLLDTTFWNTSLKIYAKYCIFWEKEAFFGRMMQVVADNPSIQLNKETFDTAVFSLVIGRSIGSVAMHMTERLIEKCGAEILSLEALHHLAKVCSSSYDYDDEWTLEEVLNLAQRHSQRLYGVDEDITNVLQVDPEFLGIVLAVNRHSAISVFETFFRNATEKSVKGPVLLYVTDALQLYSKDDGGDASRVEKVLKKVYRGLKENWNGLDGLSPRIWEELLLVATSYARSPAMALEIYQDMRKASVEPGLPYIAQAYQFYLEMMKTEKRNEDKAVMEQLMCDIKVQIGDQEYADLVNEFGTA